jgi:hypothetical protein
MANQERFIQVGVTALRNPLTGGFFPAVPLYIEATDEAVAAENRLLDNIGGVLAQRYEEYLNGCKDAGVAL